MVRLDNRLISHIPDFMLVTGSIASLERVLTSMSLSWGAHRTF